MSEGESSVWSEGECVSVWVSDVVCVCVSVEDEPVHFGKRNVCPWYSTRYWN